MASVLGGLAVRMVAVVKRARVNFAPKLDSNALGAFLLATHGLARSTACFDTMEDRVEAIV